MVCVCVCVCVGGGTSVTSLSHAGVSAGCMPGISMISDGLSPEVKFVQLEVRTLAPWGAPEFFRGGAT